MKIQTPPGMRDFYPDDMRLQNWLFDHWRKASRAFGFSEYEGPIFESLDLYKLKSGEGIVSELFSFQDRGERWFAIRPEMTPTLTRMVAAKANALPRPLKWFSIPRMCRAERPQRGRLREFFQWNADILGSDDPLADAEVVAVAVEFLRAVGLTPEEVVVKYSSRPLVESILRELGLTAGEPINKAFQLLDRHEKLGPQEFQRQWDEAFVAVTSCQKMLDALQTAEAAPQAVADASGAGDGTGPRAQVAQFAQRLEALGVGPFCRLDLKIARGLAYYTGIVFEIHARKTQLRALAGGGRYDSLTELLDGPRVPGVGFGMGDAPMLEFLKELGKLPVLNEGLDVYVIDADARFFNAALEIAGKLRQNGAGLGVDFSYKRAGVGKQLKDAAGRGARCAVIVGDEFAERHELAVKNLKTGIQKNVPAAEFLNNPRGFLDAH